MLKNYKRSIRDSLYLYLFTLGAIQWNTLHIRMLCLFPVAVSWLNRNTITELKPFETLKQDMETQLAKTPPASIDVKTNWNDSNRELKMDVVANFTQPLSGDYRLAAIVVESGVTGNTPGYNQVNAYSGGAFGEMVVPGKFAGSHTFLYCDVQSRRSVSCRWHQWRFK